MRANVPETSASRRAMAIVTLLFFMWGLITILNDILVPHLKAIFDLKYVEVMLIQFSFFSAYFAFAMPSGRLIECYKRTMVLGLLTMGAGALLFIPAAGVPSLPLFLAALIVLGAGITALQVSANPYVAVLGLPRTASSRLNLTQAFNSLGTTIAPFLGSLLIPSGAPKSIAEMHRLTPAELEPRTTSPRFPPRAALTYEPHAARFDCQLEAFIAGWLITKSSTSFEPDRKKPRKPTFLHLHVSHRLSKTKKSRNPSLVLTCLI